MGHTMRLRYLVVLLVALSLTSLFVGVSQIAPWDIFSLSEKQVQTLVISRLPRLLSIILAGSGLSIAGLIMQQLSRNKFVSPTTAGTMDAASLGILVAILLFPETGIRVKLVIAFGFALAGSLLFMQVLERVRYRETILIPLVGLMFGNIIGSVTAFFAYKHNLIQTVNTWLHGDFSGILKGRYELLYLGVPLMVLAYLYADRFTVAGLGEDFSTNLGLNYRQVVHVGLAIVALVTAVVVLTVGMLPFLGLIVPNIVTMYRGDNLKGSLPHTAALGAVFVLGCDIAGRLIIFPYEISIGMMVGVIGSGLFLYLLLRRMWAHET